jgi:hypothetical protein
MKSCGSDKPPVSADPGGSGHCRTVHGNEARFTPARQPTLSTLSGIVVLGVLYAVSGLGTARAQEAGPSATRASASATDAIAGDGPECEPTLITLDTRDPPYRTFPRPCAVYYYPYPEGYRFSSLHYWGDTGWFSIGSGLSDLVVQAPWRIRFPYPALPSGFRPARSDSFPQTVGARSRGVPATAPASRSRTPATAQALAARSASAQPSRAMPTPATARRAAQRQDDRRAGTARARSPAPWAAAARRDTNPQRWKYRASHGDERFSRRAADARRGASSAPAARSGVAADQRARRARSAGSARAGAPGSRSRYARAGGPRRRDH